MSWRAINRLNRDILILFTVSPMEEHGPHLPVGTDWFIARAIEERIGGILKEEMSVVTMPSLPIGTCRLSADFPGTLSLNWKTVRDIVAETLNALHQQGFTNTMLLTFHMDLYHIKALHDAMACARLSGMNTCEPLSAHYYRGTLLPPVGEANEVHADMKETSLGLALFPNLVDGHEKLPPVDISVDGPRALLQTMKEMGANEGYIGNPSQASISYGNQAIDQAVNICVDAARALLQKKETPVLPTRIKLLLRLI